ncbi:protein ABHD11-like [Uloborus diversus]|uniref:protein ABHD11-like n=1 Tax=Uloborus diversus TaxID=327109 RepID=UPI00240A3767|nr:protein ABHD11-like [Uloborus diversus]
MKARNILLCLSIVLCILSCDTKSCCKLGHDACEIQLSFDVFHPSSGSKKGNSPPIILLHGILDSKRTWKFIAQPLADNTKRTVFTVDARNHGDSPYTKDFSMDILADDLEDFFEQNNISKAILVGHSMGGKTSQTFSLRQPNKVEMLIVEEMSTENLTSIIPAPVMQILISLLRKSLDIVPDGSTEYVAFKIVKEYLLKRVPEALLNAEAFDVAPLYLINGDLIYKVNLDVLEEKVYTDAFENQISGLYRDRALFIYGTKSLFAVAEDKRIRKYFPQAEFLGFRDGNHLTHQKYPEAFVREVSRFITGVIDPASTC